MIKKECINCKIEFLSIGNRKKFCSQKCAAIFNNKNRITKRDKKEHGCLNCEKSTFNKKYCTIKCQGEYISRKRYTDYIKNGIVKDVSNSYSPVCFKKFILEEQGYKCNICHNKNIWNEKNIVFILDHIDGNSTNNSRNNLRLICPNCDSQLDTYKSKNKNSGRHYRRIRRLEGKSF